MTSQWQVSSMYLSHPVHGAFTCQVYGQSPDTYATALRCYSVGKRLLTEWVGGTDGEGRPIQYTSLEAAQAAVAQRCSELDAGVSAVCVRGNSEQLEAMREVASCR